MRTSVLAVILLLSIAMREVIGVPVAENCAAKYQASLNETMRLKESCAEAEFRDCCQVYTSTTDIIRIVFDNVCIRSFINNLVCI